MRQRLLAASFGAWHRQGSDGATDPLAEESLALAARSNEPPSGPRAVRRRLLTSCSVRKNSGCDSCRHKVTLRTPTGGRGGKDDAQSFYHPASHGVFCLWAGARPGPGPRQRVRAGRRVGGRQSFVHTSQASDGPDRASARRAHGRVHRLERAFDVCGMGADGDRDVLCDSRPPRGDAADRVLRLPLSDDAGVRGQPEHGLHPRRWFHQSVAARAVTVPAVQWWSSSPAGSGARRRVSGCEKWWTTRSLQYLAAIAFATRSAWSG